uniref:Ras-GEF domain-containing protein n=2 Tax=Bursaphelenchus xylophilus TaxID=6326 RepID=A0A1I7RIR6_BURXY
MMASSYATPSTSSSPVNGFASISPEPRFNPFNSSSESSLTINSIDSQSCVYGEDGMLMSAGPDALWKKLLPTQDYEPPKKLVFTLLLNLRAYVSPAEMMQKLIQNCIFEQHTSLSNFNKHSHSKLFEHVFEFVSEWTTNIPYDFRTEEMRQRLSELFSLCATDPSQHRRCAKLTENLNRILAKRDHYERAMRNLEAPYEVQVERVDQLVGLTSMGVTAQVVAQQLAHIELERLSMIGVDEIVQTLGSSSLETLGEHNTDASGNIKYYIKWFNQLSSFTATEILKHTKKKHRVRCIEFFIDLGKECINIGNFNSLMAIVAGISTQAVTRLKKTWQRVEKAKLEILQHQLNPSGNFVSYRATLNAAIWRFEGAKNDNERVIIPFFGLLLKDLYMIHRSSLEPLPNGQLKIAMFAQFAQHMTNLIQWKDRPCPFKRNTSVLQYLLLSQTYSDNDLLNLSFENEPPETPSEREQYKKLTENKSDSSSNKS